MAFTSRMSAPRHIAFSADGWHVIAGELFTTDVALQALYVNVNAPVIKLLAAKLRATSGHSDDGIFQFGAQISFCRLFILVEIKEETYSGWELSPPRNSSRSKVCRRSLP